ncbi:hypothetical protein F9L69_03820 [Brucella melitensis]|uniref:Uncharacterized protein n=5 Tax=Brucella TaxID=234 RepID=Q57C41_BRUAB|nr:hypothetical protein BruAb1_1465 [Brucella abortus bv. 1 str. 9-941]ACO01230.1 Hypothetical protein, conserved [Brucella melitensis ATCC 23457]AWT06105.1 hypothetical protein DMS17_07505 [Brucella melitensis]AYU63344.1 hypothetical protein EAI02_07105 [Brucella abortus]EEH14125.1 Hypothetical protein, conserved [Brucella ceti str. Cudo]EEX80803.1 predicted protein [Brucella abortus bv. 9 str. C68]EEY05011.1 predicted protein [Brucella neotomae 5K33]EEZ12267.1 predicted protein [Brucella m
MGLCTSGYKILIVFLNSIRMNIALLVHFIQLLKRNATRKVRFKLFPPQRRKLICHSFQTTV